MDGAIDSTGDLQADVTKPDGLLTPVFVSIPAGTFTMGSPASEPCRASDEEQHQVTLTHGFEISDHEVTQGEFKAMMGYNPAHFTSCGLDCPVEMVSWNQAAAYCNALSAHKGLTACYTCSGSGASVTCQEAVAYSGASVYSCPGYRLPTEAEWEYAYRAGTTTAFYSGVNDAAQCNTNLTKDANADKIGWYAANAGNAAHPVKQKQTNTWGLYDMAGNVFEWCHDRDQTGGLGSSAVTDPWGAPAGSKRLARGGCWQFTADFLRAAYRSQTSQASQYSSVGFRCCKTK